MGLALVFTHSPTLSDGSVPSHSSSKFDSLFWFGWWFVPARALRPGPPWLVCSAEYQANVAYSLLRAWDQQPATAVLPRSQQQFYPAVAARSRSGRSSLKRDAPAPASRPHAAAVHGHTQHFNYITAGHNCEEPADNVVARRAYPTYLMYIYIVSFYFCVFYLF